MADLLRGARKAFIRPRGFYPLLRWQTPSRLLGVGQIDPLPPGANPDIPTFTTFALELPGPRILRRGRVRPFFLGWPGSVLSPDGKWMLQFSRADVAGLRVQALSLDGMRRHLWTLDPHRESQPGRRLWPASTPLWTHQGRRWVMLLFEYSFGSEAKSPYPLRAVTGRLDHPGKLTTISLGRASDATGGAFIWDGIDYGQLIDSPDGDLLMGVHLGDHRARRQPHLSIYALRLSAKGRDRQERSFRLDEGFEAAAVDYSPGTRRLAVLARGNDAPKDLWRIYCLSLDGREKTLVGEVRGRYLSGLQWLPGGHQLSVDDGRAYWVLDVPSGVRLTYSNRDRAL